jgi:enoyl-CoA hydratase/carnithine racemase
MYEAIEVQQHGRVAIVALNRPEKLNAFNTTMLNELGSAFDALEGDTNVRAVIVKGNGRAFSSGFDIGGGNVKPTTGQGWRRNAEEGNRVWYRIWRSRLPFVAAVHGYCLGGACELSMVCDLTLASESAQFGEPEIQFQSTSPFNMMPWVLGMKKAKELLLTGDRISSQEALAIGMVNRVVPDDQLETEALALATKLAKMPREAMGLNKAGINRGYDIRGFQAAIDYGVEIYALALTSGSEEREEFFRIGREQGMSAAFKWRDEQYGRETREVQKGASE